MITRGGTVSGLWKSRCYVQPELVWSNKPGKEPQKIDCSRNLNEFWSRFFSSSASNEDVSTNTLLLRETETEQKAL